jgi:hypothetical protein
MPQVDSAHKSGWPGNVTPSSKAAIQGFFADDGVSEPRLSTCRPHGFKTAHVNILRCTDPACANQSKDEIEYWSVVP